MNAQEQSLFNAGVKGELRTAKRVPETISEARLEDMATLYIDRWLSEKQNEDFFNVASVVDCLVAFKTWLADAPEIETASVTPVNITVTLTLPIGKDGASVQLSLSAIPVPDLVLSFIEVYDNIVEAATAFRAKRLSSGTAGSGSNSNGNTSAGSTEKITITHVKVENKNGKNYYRCAGGRWMKFGVPCWKEVWSEAGINTDRYVIGDNPVNFDAEVQLGSDGKPEKVIRLFNVS